MLQLSWDRYWKSLDAIGDGHMLMNRILAAYNEPHRKYHTQKHLSECLSLFHKHFILAEEPTIVEAAIWFHDAIYNVRANDNEYQSAVWAEIELKQAGVVQEWIDRVKGHILATSHSALPQGQDQMLIVDIDLSILGASRERFEEYERQIREEYNWVKDDAYNSKRREILTSFILRHNIYNTRELREMLEDQARDNLQYSLQKLGG